LERVESIDGIEKLQETYTNPISFDEKQKYFLFSLNSSNNPWIQANTHPIEAIC
jgi:hypothetical protein